MGSKGTFASPPQLAVKNSLEPQAASTEYGMEIIAFLFEISIDNAGKANDKKETVYEIADLVYHVMVLMIEMGISLEDIQAELASSHMIDKKVKQEKMV